MPPTPPRRSSYRHGNLRNALLTAGVDLARAGGPDAVVLREATRRAGVVPNAAYRHFTDRGELLHAVCAAAMSQLAIAMEHEQACVHTGEDPAAAARARLRAIGAGYLTFALDEPGLYRTAFSAADDLDDDESAAGNSGLSPFQLLTSALDDLVTVGVLPLDRRPGAEYLAWSAVHGLAMLVIDGPLRTLERTHVDQLTQRLLYAVEKGL